MGSLSPGLFALVTPWWLVVLWVLAPFISIGIMCASVAAARRRGPTTDPGAGALVFRYPSLLRWGSVCFAAGILAAVSAQVVAHPPRSPRDTVFVLLTYVMFAGLTGSLVWECLRFRMVVGPDGLNRRSPWRRRRFIRWDEVADVSFSGPLGWFEVRATDGSAVRMSVLVGGLEAFLEACEHRLTPRQLEPARAAYNFLRRTFPSEASGLDDSP